MLSNTVALGNGTLREGLGCDSEGLLGRPVSLQEKLCRAFCAYFLCVEMQEDSDLYVGSGKDQLELVHGGCSSPHTCNPLISKK